MMEQARVRGFYPEVEPTCSLTDEIAALDGLIESQLRILKEKLAGGQKLFELEVDAAKLTELVRARKNKKEWLGGLSKSASVAR
jgi:hypothetical protein